MSTEKVFKLLNANKFVCFVHFCYLVALLSSSELNTKPFFIKTFLNKKENTSLYTKDHHLHTYCELLMSTFSICNENYPGDKEAEPHPMKCPAVSGKTSNEPYLPRLSMRRAAMLKTSLDLGRQAEKWNHTKMRCMCPSTLDWVSASSGDCCHCLLGDWQLVWPRWRQH